MNFCLKPELTKYKAPDPPQKIRWRRWTISTFNGPLPDRIKADPSAGCRWETTFIIATFSHFGQDFSGGGSEILVGYVHGGGGLCGYRSVLEFGLGIGLDEFSGFPLDFSG